MEAQNDFGYGYASYCAWDSLPTWLQDVANNLPHGSGIDYDWTFYVQKNGKIVFGNEYHGMNEAGFYVCSVPFSVKIDPKKPLDFRVVFHAKNRYWVNYWDLENYLPEILYACIAEHTPVRIPCEHCHGQGYRTVMELATIRKEAASVTLAMLRNDGRTKFVESINSLIPEKAKLVCWNCEGIGEVKA